MSRCADTLAQRLPNIGSSPIVESQFYPHNPHTHLLTLSCDRRCCSDAIELQRGPKVGSRSWLSLAWPSVSIFLLALLSFHGRRIERLPTSYSISTAMRLGCIYGSLLSLAAPQSLLCKFIPSAIPRSVAPHVIASQIFPSLRAHCPLVCSLSFKYILCNSRHCQIHKSFNRLKAPCWQTLSWTSLEVSPITG